MGKKRKISLLFSFLFCIYIYIYIFYAKEGSGGRELVRWKKWERKEKKILSVYYFTYSFLTRFSGIGLVPVDPSSSPMIPPVVDDDDEQSS